MEDLQCLTVEETCERLRVSRCTVYRLLNDKELSSITVGRSRRILFKSLSEYAERGGSKEITTR
jgi:excisionase family DNA binding protein